MFPPPKFMPIFWYAAPIVVNPTCGVNEARLSREPFVVVLEVLYAFFFKGKRIPVFR